MADLQHAPHAAAADLALDQVAPADDVAAPGAARRAVVLSPLGSAISGVFGPSEGSAQLFACRLTSSGHGSLAEDAV